VLSYDIKIVRAENPDDQPEEFLDVKRLVSAVESFPPFAARGLTWDEQNWTDMPEFAGLYMLLNNHAPGRTAPGQFDYRAGEAEYCCMHLAAAGYDLDRCYELAAHIAERTEACAWDLQTGEQIV
jgi:hypothetical protein